LEFRLLVYTLRDLSIYSPFLHDKSITLQSLSGPETHSNPTEPRIGVFLCHCGGNIGNTVDVEAVKNAASQLRFVKCAETSRYLCSSPGQNLIRNKIREQGLDRIVIGACSPRMHLKTFRDLCLSGGINPYLVEIANLREQVSWTTTDKERATDKAIDIIAGAVGRATYLEPLAPTETKVNSDVAVIGGGVSGIVASLELASQGHKIFMVERKPSIGGHMAQLSKTYPTLDCSLCILSPKLAEMKGHPLVELMTNTEVTAVDGSPGHYSLTLTRRPRYVNEDKCTSCGECAKVCPIEVSDEFEEGTARRKAIYLPFPQAVPYSYVIDEKNCTKCWLCVKACKHGAINPRGQAIQKKVEVGSVILATGFRLFDPSALTQYGFGTHPNIITNLQLERLIEHGVYRPSDGKTPRKIAWIQCVGSRDIRIGQAYCSRICCMASVKEAVLLRELVPNLETWIFYQDMRAAGKGYEEFYNAAAEQGVQFVRGRGAEILPFNKDELLVRAEDTLLGERMEITFDLVVLCPALLPGLGSGELAGKFGVQTGSDGFLLERHYKLRPVDSQNEGVFLSGCCLGPKDVRESVIEALSAASRTTSLLGKGVVTISPEKAYVIQDRCNSCGDCVKICPTHAIEILQNGANIKPIPCVGCGLCIPACPTNAIDLKNSTESQLMAETEGVGAATTAEPKVIAFVEGTSAYTACDLVGLARKQYSTSVRVIQVPSVGRLSPKHLLAAFASGADGVVMIEGEGTVLGEEAFRAHVSKLKTAVTSKGIDSLRVFATRTTIPQYAKLASVFQTFAGRIQRLGPLTLEDRSMIRQVAA
jgi:heterodisulfide reductase subunit A